MRIAFTFLICVFVNHFAAGQNPVAQFNASAYSGCSPLTVTFKDQSTGNPTLWNWDFGNGQLSNIQNPTVTFSTPGTYTVTLVVKNANGVDGIVKNNYIVVNPSPTAAFVANNTLVCAPATVQFTDQSVANAGSLVQWAWVFSDGTTASTPNVSKTFSTPGFYDVSLTVTSSTGCKAAAGINRYIRVVPGLTVDFVNSDPQTCKTPFPVNFTNQTSGPGTLSYNWDLGNGQTPTTQDPATIYLAAGTYTVKLSAQSTLGCTGNTQKTITVAGRTTAFTGLDSTCLNTPVTFNNTSSPVPNSVVWDFGDGTQSTQLNPSKAYSVPGIYTVKLVTTFKNCTDSATKTIKIAGKPVVDFSASQTGSCSIPVLVNFTNLSPDVVSSSWDFGDGSPASPSPFHSYTANGSYDVTLTITDSKGCQNSITKPNYINISAPTIKFTNLPAGGCGPFSITPNANVITVDGVASYLWDFGDLSPTSTLANPPHTYLTNGSYIIKLTITTNGGCTTFNTSTVHVGSGVTVNIGKSAAVACNSSGVTFTDLSTPAGTAPATQWLWDFHDGDVSSLQNPFHKYRDTGYFDVTLTVITNGCPTTATFPQFVHASPPVAAFKDSVDCSNKRTVTFTDSSKNNTGSLTYAWDFGNGTNSTLPVNTITYAGTGTYNIVLAIDNGICKDTARKTLFLFDEKAGFTQNKFSACHGDSIHFVSTNTPAFIKTYSWSVNGTPTGTNSASLDTVFTAFGSYTIALSITDINGCKDTKTGVVNITGPTAKFSVANNGGCLNKTIVFTDASLPAGAIKKWAWNFGDGSKQNFSAGPFTHLYSDTGSYKVKLIITDTIGCTDTAIVPNAVRIDRVKAGFSVNQANICQGAVLQFSDSSYDGNLYTYAWNFGDGAVSTLQNPTHTYVGNDSSYTVKLVIKDTVGCTDSLTRINYIKVAAPKAAFDVKDSTTICPPLETKFTFKGKNYQSVLWDFGDGGSSVSTATASHFYNDYGSYTVKLYVTGFGGCVDSASSIVNVYNPYTAANIGYPDTTVCNSLLVDFTIKTPSSTKFYFYPGDGMVDSSQNHFPQHFYNLPSYYKPSITLVDSQFCQVGIGEPNTIKILGAVPLFAKDKKIFCDSGLVTFTNFTIANDPIVSQTWVFTDGTTATTKDVIHFFSKPGFYTPHLDVTTQFGCKSSYMDTIKVLGTPHPIINSVDAICNNLVVNFNGNLQTPDTAITWAWQFGDGQSSSLQNAQIKYPAPGNYHVNLKTSNSLNCSDTTSKNITVYPLPSIKITGDTSLIVSTGITMPISYSSNVQFYNWTPPTYLSCTDCPNPFVQPQFTTSYTVTATDSNGCISSRNVTILVLCNNKNFFIPNTFSPNNDGNNDWFYPRGKGLDRIQAMRIFNRWGELVFEKRNFPANDYTSGWNGTYKGKPAGMDTYVYMIDIVCENATIITYKGNITLIR